MGKCALLILTLIFVFFTILIETVVFILQLKGQKFSRWIGKSAFTIHMFITGCLWLVTFFLIFILQFKKHPHFHSSLVVKYAGLILLILGLGLAIWGFKLLGLRRSLGLNFFEEDVPVVSKRLYKHMKNPEDYGLWIALMGFAAFTRSTYNLIIAFEFIILMIPHLMVENIPLRKQLHVSH